MQPHAAILILAAGASGRLGQPKQSVRYRGEALVRRAVRIAVEANLGPVIVVLAAGDELSALEIADLPHRAVVNADSQRGMGSSIRAGVHALDQSIATLIIMLCDQLAVSADLLRALADELNRSQALAVASVYGGTVGVPAIFQRSMFDHLRNLSDHAGAKSLLQGLGDRLSTVDFPAGEDDLDTPGDLQKLL